MMRTLCLFVCLCVFGATVPSGPGPPHSRGFYITHNDIPHSVGLLWTSDQLVAETSTSHYTTITKDKLVYFQRLDEEFIKPLKMDLTEGSETSAKLNLTPGKYPKKVYKIQNPAKI
jgi:hypothetical protein